MTRPKTTNQIVAHLLSAIPPPRETIPKPQDSWATLKLGDRLTQTQVTEVSTTGLNDSKIGAMESESPIFSTTIELIWEVILVNSAGVTLASKNEHGRYVTPPKPIPSKIELTDRDWRNTWKRVPKRRKKGESGD